ncbi:uncharacterized protein [Rutidosis leptorrhynchoides]|uniref:uncharacterized protein n=1 Tax=Rutidosis leptorrhynchoides TaxID=125765 RepID=UPI003A992DC5
MEGNKKKVLRTSKQVNDKQAIEYENERRARIADNERRLQEHGIKRIVESLNTEIAKSKKKTKKQSDSNNKDPEYTPEPEVETDAHQPRVEADTRGKATGKKPKRSFIAPQTMTRNANISTKRVTAISSASNVLSLNNQKRKGQVSETRVKNTLVQSSVEGHKEKGHQVDKSNGKKTKSTSRVTNGEFI